MTPWFRQITLQEKALSPLLLLHHLILNPCLHLPFHLPPYHLKPTPPSPPSPYLCPPPPPPHLLLLQPQLLHPLPILPPLALFPPTPCFRQDFQRRQSSFQSQNPHKSSCNLQTLKGAQRFYYIVSFKVIPTMVRYSEKPFQQVGVNNVDQQQQQQQGEEEVQVLHPLSYMSGNLKKKMEEVLGCRFLSFVHSNFHHHCFSFTKTKCLFGH